jgi:hypothetical protein
MRRLLPTLALVLVLGLAACASQGDSTPSSEPTGTPGLVPGLTITGVLSADSVEGGCIFLEAEDGERYELIWPDGWRVNNSLELLDADGEVVADGSDVITVRGQLAEEMGSICQIGQIVEVIDVSVAD